MGFYAITLMHLWSLRPFDSIHATDVSLMMRNLLGMFAKNIHGTKIRPDKLGWGRVHPACRVLHSGGGVKPLWSI